MDLYGFVGAGSHKKIQCGARVQLGSKARRPALAVGRQRMLDRICMS